VLVCAGLVFLIALFLYSWTLAPTVTLVDSGELIVVARSLGVAHPPGFPFWVMLAHIASLLPWGSVAARVNFSSAFFAALASSILTLVVAELMIVASYLASWRRSPKKNPRQGKKTRSDALPAETDANLELKRLFVLAPALGSGLLMAFSRTLWSYATITEVYTLNALLIILVFLLIFRWRQRIIVEKRRVSMAGSTGRPLPAVTAHDAFLYAGAIVFGLALGVHHVTVALILPALAVVVYRTEGLSFFLSKRLLYAALVSLAALVAVYAYLPLAASRAPIISWGNTRSLEAVWWHISGRQYQVFFSFSLQEMGQQFVEFGRMALREFGWPWMPLTLLLAVAGFCSVLKQDRTTFWFLLLTIGANLGYGLCYSIAEDKDAYYLPTFISIAIAAGFGLRWLIQLALSQSLRAKNGYIDAALPVLLASAIALTGNWPFNNRRNYFIASDYVENLLSAIEPNGLLLTMDWQVASPMFYTQEIEQRRRDVKVVDVKLLHRPWYFDYLRRAYPDLIERSRNQIDAYVADLNAWEHDPQAYANDPVLTRRISALFQEMLQSVVTNENRVAPVYITEEVAFADKREGELTNWLNKSFQLVPQGLVLKLEGNQDFHDSRDVELQTRGLADGTLRFETDDVVSNKVLPVYTSMLVNRGRYLARFNQHERAIAAFKQALELNPSYALAQQGLQESTNRLRNPGP
jgi:tetratricopeptide (TPR) repeat protein